MAIFLLSNSANYFNYWSDAIDNSTRVDFDTIAKLNSDDILVVEYKMYLTMPKVNAKLLVLDNEPTFDISISLLKKGIKAYGNVYMHKSHILSAIQSLSEDKIWMYPEFIASMLGKIDKVDDDSLEKKLVSLTKREKEISMLILDGLTNKEIAIELSITTNTIKVHTKNIYNKLNVSDRLALFSLLK